MEVGFLKTRPRISLFIALRYKEAEEEVVSESVKKFGKRI